MKNIPISLVFILVLVGCAQHQYQAPQDTYAQQQSARLRGQSNEWNMAKQTCISNLKANPSVQLVYAEVFYENNSSPNKVELMSSTAKVTEKQKKAVLEYLSLNQACRAIDTQYGNSFPTIVSAMSAYYGDMDIVYAKLLSKEITIGQANREKTTRLSKLNSDTTNASQEIDNKLSSQHNQEVQATQAQDAQRRAIAAQYLINLQNINAQQQMNNKPVNTTCNRYGNQVNCTTQ